VFPWGFHGDVGSLEGFQAFLEAMMVFKGFEILAVFFVLVLVYRELRKF